METLARNGLNYGRKVNNFFKFIIFCLLLTLICSSFIECHRHERGQINLSILIYLKIFEIGLETWHENRGAYAILKIKHPSKRLPVQRQQ